MLLNCDVEEDFESPLACMEIKPVNLKGNQSWIFIGRTDAEAEVPIVWHLMQRANSLEKTLCWERLKAEGEAGDGGWDGWMASLTQWTWTCANSKRWWETEKPGVRQSMGSQTIRHNLAAEQSRTTDWTTINMNHCNCVFSFTTLNKAQTNRQMSSSSIFGLSGITLYSHGPCKIKENWISQHFLQ